VISSPDAAAQIRTETKGRGADVVLDFIGSSSTLELGAAITRMMGDLTIVGTAGGTLPVSFFSLPYEVSIQTTYWGTRPELTEVLNFGARGLLRPEITTYPLDKAMEAYRAMKSGDLKGRAVVVPA
jgi:propanol-preferring alcohol dehydrogenase